MPLALASKREKRSSGLSQISRRQERCSRSISNASRSSGSRSSPSVMSSTIAPWVSTRRAHSLLKLCSEVAMRVPPDQSATFAPTAASASSGSLALIARVTLVSRVPNRNVCTRLRASVTAWRKCRNSRVYWLMEPEMSSSATIGGDFVRGPRYLRSITAPPALRLERNVRRMSTRWPCRWGARRRVLTSSSESTRRLMASLAAAISAVVICAKSFFCSTSRSDTVRRASSSSCGGLRSVSPIPASSASWTRCAPGGGFSSSRGGACGSMAAMSLSMVPRRRKKMRNACSKMSECSWRFTNTACSVQEKSSRVPTPAAATAASASITAPGPTGMPAARSARAKWTMFSASRPASPSRPWPFPLPGRSAGEGRREEGESGVIGGASLRRAQLGVHLVDQLLGLAAFDAGDVVLVLQQHPEGVGGRRGVERDRVELGERRSPIERLGDARRLEQVLLAQRLHKMHDLLGQGLADARHLGAHDLELALGRRIADPVVEAAALERVVNFARPVRRDHDDRRMRGLHGAELRNRYLEVGEHLQQECLERLVSAVELVDQQHRRARRIGLERL